MPKLINSIRNVVTLAGPMRRFRRARPGSVLILVIALLVLLALIGTAYISTTRVERYTSAQNAFNTQADLLMDGLTNMVKSSLIEDVFGITVAGGRTLRPPLIVSIDPTVSSGYNHFTSTSTDLFLGDRVPESNGAGNTFWHGIGFPLTATANGTYAFDLIDFATGKPTQLNLGAASKKHDYQVYITSKVLNGQLLPALAIHDNSAAAVAAPWLTPNGLSNVPANATFVAADVDGDGIADSGMFKLPIGQINGIDYYAAVRIVDNNSAVNVSSANSKLPSGSASSPYNAGDPAVPALPADALSVFRSSVGLFEMLNATPPPGAPQAVWELNGLNQYRVFNVTSNLVINPTVNPGFNYSPASSAYADSSGTAIVRTDFNFFSMGDALEHQLTRRASYAGFNTAAQKYQWLGLSQSASLAYRFCLMSPSSGYSVLEQILPNELLLYDYLNQLPRVRSSPYSPNEIGGAGAPGLWYGDNFDFANLATPKPLRALLTCDNPVSNGVAGHYTNKGKYDPTLTSLYHFGDLVYVPLLAGGSYSFVCIQDHVPSAVAQSQLTAVTAQTMATNTWTQLAAGGPALTLTQDQYWTFVPWTSVPLKTNANVSTFAQLWTAFWNVMYDHPSSTSADGFGQPAFGYPLYSGDANNNQEINQDNAVPATQARMFRNPIRDPNAASGNANSQYLTPGQTMLLRSALAALNTVSLRSATGTTNVALAPNGLDKVISREVHLPADPADVGSKAYRVMLFGATKQPYISDFYVNTSGVGGSVSSIAIELSNPYPNAMTLNGWQLAVMNRSTTGYSTAASLLMTVTSGFVIPTGTQIPAATATGPGKLILWDGAKPTWLPASGPPGTSPQVVAAAGIAAFLTPTTGMELAVLRTRDPAGTPGTPAPQDPNNTYDETVPADLVPVDQIDMTGLTPGAEWVYRRATATAGTPWNFVYSGPYSTNATIQFYRHNGFVQVPPPPGNVLTSFGVDKTAYPGSQVAVGNAATYQTFPVQVANTDAAGWNQRPAAPPYAFPFGGFARNGDLLQVPFIGAYRILPEATPVPALTTTVVVEMNSLPMDSAFADDQDLLDDAQTADFTATTPPTQMREQIGRFCPVGTVGQAAPNDFDYLPPTSPVGPGIPSNSNASWRYHWARSLFDFVTVQSPDNDYLPNADPLSYPVATAVAGVANKDQTTTNAQTAGKSEDTVGVQGLVNINTAPAKVLEALPWFPPGYADTNSITPATLATAIVNYRELPTSTPFQTVFDLYKVPLYRQAADDLAVDAQTAANQQRDGDLSPYAAGTSDNMKYDFEKSFLLLNRISNVITTRSDSFTCYVLLQGWRGVGTTSPTLVVQRRAAFILDRNNITSTNVTPNVYKVPTN
jgi:hypothetical protein